MISRNPSIGARGLLLSMVLVLSLWPDDPLPATGDEGPRILSPQERDRIFFLGKSERAAARTLTARETAAAASQDDFDVTNYFLDLDFDDVTRTVNGSASVTATSLVDGLQQILLNLLDNMTVTSVTRGAIGLSFTHTGDILAITLDRVFDTGQSFEVVVTYGGSPQGGGFGTFGWNKYASAGDGQMVWSLSEPEGARNWWPCKDRPDDKATVQEWWTVKSAWTATGNGLLVGVQTVPGGRKQYRWQAVHPLTTYLVSIAATDYVTFSDTYTPLAGGSMPIDYYVYSEDLADAQASYSEIPAMTQYFAQTFGEYPFVEDKYGMSSFPFGGAMEHSTNTSYGYQLIDGAHNYDWIIAHELAHQWWGDSVSPLTWADIWLNEGFASHAEALWAESNGGSSSYRAYMDSLYRSFFDGPVYGPNELFGGTVYNKGAWVLHMLRGVMGDTAFFLSLRDWYQNHMDGVGSTAQFQATAEGRHGGALDWFFQEWVYDENRPDYEYGYTTADLGDGVHRTYVKLRQVQTNAGAFTMPVDLELATVSGTDLRTVWNDAIDQDFVLDTTEPPIAVGFDPENWILKSSATPILLDDGDADGVPDHVDNCQATANPTQADLDGDGSGDACDEDDDGDLLVDALDCAPLDAAEGTPGEVAQLTLSGAGGQPTGLSWTATARADSYDLVRGSIHDLSAGLGSCHRTGMTGTSFVDSDQPLSGEGFGYLVRGYDDGCGGGGSLGTDSSGAPRPSPCP